MDKECIETISEAIDVIKNILDQIDALEGCDCGGSGLCSICDAHRFIEHVEEEFDL